MKRLHLVTLFAALALLICCALPTQTEAATEGYYTYTVSDGEATITKCSVSYLSASITIPSTLGGYPVTQIGDNAFYDEFSEGSLLTGITIPDSVTSIGYCAFRNCNRLSSITIPDSVTSIGSCAFMDCTGLKTVYFNANNCTVAGSSDDPIFYGCTNLTTINIGPDVKTIPEGAFAFCTKLTDITIPDSVTSIGDWAFYECNSLTYHVYDNGKYLGNNMNPYMVLVDVVSTDITACQIHSNTKYLLSAFRECASLQSITIPDGVSSIGSSAFCDCSSLTSITIPNSVTSIGIEAFRKCTSLQSITIPDGVTSIGNSAFSGCSSLTSITIPDSVTSIGTYAFYGCWGLEAVYYGGTAEEWALINIYYGNDFGSKLITVVAKGTCGSNAAWKLDENGMLTISGTGAIADFENAAGVAWADYSEQIKKAVIQEGVTAVGQYAFSYCNNLTEVTIADGVTNIGDDAFSYCSSLLSITIPNSITVVGDYAFEGCGSLTDVNYGGTAAQWAQITIGEDNDPLLGANLTTDEDIKGTCGNDATWKLDENGMLTISGTGAMADFQNAAYTAWADYSDRIKKVVIEEGITVVGRYAFSSCSNLEEVTLPSTIKTVCSYAFEQCYSLKAVKLPNELKTIESYAFYRSESITDLVIPDSVTTIGASAFSRCEGLTQITLGTGVTTLERYTFYLCTSLASITIPDNITVIGDQVFQDCGNLQTITLSKNLTAIGNQAFSGCAALTDVYYDNYLENWEQITICEENRQLLAATLHAREVLGITDQPQSMAAKPGETVTFTVAAKGQGLTYKWQYRNAGATAWNNTKLDGYNTNALTVSNLNGVNHNGRQYRCVITDEEGKRIETEIATLLVSYFMNNAKNQSVKIGEDAVFSVNYSIQEGVAYQWQYKGNSASSTWANTIATGNKTASITVTGKATNNRYMYRCKIIDPNFAEPIYSKEVYLNIVEDAPTIISQPVDKAGVCGSYVNFSVKAEGAGLTYQWQWSDDGETWANSYKSKGYSTAAVSIRVSDYMNGRYYRCVVKTYNGSGFNRVYSEVVRLTVLPAADIQEQLPQTVTVKVGETVDLSVLARGEGLTYQWQWAKFKGNWKNTALSGYNTDTLTITNVRTDMNGRYYRVVITNAYNGSVTSTVVQLIVEP